MPCRLEPWEQEYERKRMGKEQVVHPDYDRVKKIADDLTAELDRTREALLDSIEGRKVDRKVLNSIKYSQVMHRKDDLERLRITFEAYLEKVNNADPKKPLKPQLGFDPDEF